MDSTQWDCLVNFLSTRSYPSGSSENEKRVIRRQAKRFFLKNDRILYYKRMRGNSDEIDNGILVVVGETVKNNIIKETHQGIGGGHFGMYKTFEKIVHRYWWPGFKSDVEKYVRACNACRIANRSNKPQSSQLRPIGVTSELGYHWCIDLVGPLQETQNGNRFNQTLINQLINISNEKTNDWDQHIQSILFANRVSVQSSSTKKTPFEMMFDSKPRLPAEIDRPHNEIDPSINFIDLIAHRMTALSDKLEKTKAESLQNLAEAQEKQKKLNDTKRMGIFYDKGELVLMYNGKTETRQSDKISTMGPYKMYEATGEGIYRLIDPIYNQLLDQKVSTPKEDVNSIGSAKAEIWLENKRKNYVRCMKRQNM